MNKINYNNEIAIESKYPGYYCTKSGKVITVKVKGGQGRIDFLKPRELAYKVDKDGYLIVTISLKNDKSVGKNKYVRVHRLIYETFNGDIKNDLTVDHIDNCVNNNKLSNLQLLTRELNAIKRHKNWVEVRRSKYNVYDEDGDIIHSHVDKKFLSDKYTLNDNDYHKYINKNKISNKMKQLGIIVTKV